MIHAPKNAKHYPKLGIYMADWEVNYFQYLVNGYKVGYISKITNISKTAYDHVKERLKDDLGLSTTFQLIAVLLRKKIIK